MVYLKLLKRKPQLEDEFSIKGLIPVENSKEYKMKIASYTQGKGMFVTKFYGYKKVPAEYIF